MELAVLLAVAALVVAGAGMALYERRAARRPDETPPGVTVITEEWRFSSGGVAAIAFLVLHNALTVVGFVGAAGAFLSINVAAFWTGGNVLCGIGIICGRTRRYVIRGNAPLKGN